MSIVEAAARAALAGQTVAAAEPWWGEAYRDWVTSLDPVDDAVESVGVVASGGLDRIRWRFGGAVAVERSIERWFDRFDGGIDRARSFLERVGGATATWLEASEDGLFTGLEAARVTKTREALSLLPASRAADGFRLWWSDSEARRLAAVAAPAGPELAAELVVVLPGRGVDAQAAAALALFSAIGVEDPPDDALGLALAQARPGLAARVALTPTGLTEAGVLIPDPTTETVLRVRDALGENGDEALVIFEGALDVERRTWLELVTARRHASALHYDLGTA